VVRKLRGVLIAILLLAMVATIGGVEVVRSKSLTGGARDGGTAAADRGAAAKDEGLLSQWWNGAKNIVGQPKPRPETVIAGLTVDQPPPTGQAWPAQKRVKELTGKRTANSRVYQLSDGRTQAEISATPLHYRDAKGKFQPIETRSWTCGWRVQRQGDAAEA
jgi:hypothetical protein